MLVAEVGRLVLFVGLLFVCSIFWGSLYFTALQEYGKEVYQMDKPRVTLNVAMISGFALFGAWTVLAVKRRNIPLGCATMGIVIAFCFFVGANTENIGYTTELLAHAGDSRGNYVILNPFLHVGGGTYISFYATSVTLPSSVSIENQFLYLAYGELISFSITGICLLTRKLACYVTSLVPLLAHVS